MIPAASRWSSSGSDGHGRQRRVVRVQHGRRAQEKNEHWLRAKSPELRAKTQARLSALLSGLSALNSQLPALPDGRP